MSYGPDYDYYTQPDRANPSRTVHLADKGMSDGDALWDWIEQYAADDTEVIIPSGTYDVGFGYRRITADNCIVRGEEPSGSVVAEVPGGYSEQRYQPVLRTYDRFELANIQINGVIADDSESGKLKTEALGSDSYVYVERYRNPDGGANGSGGVFVGGDSAGETMFKHCEVNHAGDNGIYGSDPGESYGNNGPVYVEHGRYYNNNISGVRLGSSNSYAWRVCAGNDAVSNYPDTKSGAPTNQRAIRLRSGMPRTGLEVVECDVYNADLGVANKAVEIYSGSDSGFSGEIRASRITNDEDSVAAIRAGSGGDFTARNCHATGGGDLSFDIPETGTCRGSGCDEASCDFQSPPSGTTSDWPHEARLQATDSYLQSVDFDPQADRVAYTGDPDSNGNGVWFHTTGGDWPLETAVPYATTVHAGAFSHDGHYVAGTAGYGGDGTVQVLVAGETTLVASVTNPGPVRMAATDPNNDYLAAWWDDPNTDLPRVRIYDWATLIGGTDNPDPVATLPHDTGGIRAGAFSPDGQRFAFAGHDGRVYVHTVDRSTDDFTREGSYAETDSRVWGLSFSPDGQHILSGHAHELTVVNRVDASNGYPLAAELTETTGKVRDTAWARDNRHLGYCSNDATAYTHSVGDWAPAARLSTSTTNGVGCAFSRDSRWFAYAGVDDGVHVYTTPEPTAGSGAPNVLDGGTDGVWQAGPDAALTALGEADIGQLAVGTLSPTDVTDNTATLRGEITAFENLGETEVYFEYQPSDGSGTLTTTSRKTVSSAGRFSLTVDGLSASTSYDVYAVAESAALSDQGNTVTFTTGSTGTVIDDFEHGDLASNGWNGPEIGTAFRLQSSTTIGRAGSHTLHLPSGQGGTNIMDSAPGDGLGDYPGPGKTWECWFMFPSTGGTRTRVQLYYGHSTSQLNDSTPDNCYGVWLRGNRSPGRIRLYTYSGGSFGTDLFDVAVDDPHFQAGEQYRCEIQQGGTSTNPTHTVTVYHGDAVIGQQSVDDTSFDGQAIALGNPTEMEGEVYLDDFRLL
jgi:WD40 repeat protein